PAARAMRRTKTVPRESKELLAPSKTRQRCPPMSAMAALRGVQLSIAQMSRSLDCSSRGCCLVRRARQDPYRHLDRYRSRRDRSCRRARVGERWFVAPINSERCGRRGESRNQECRRHRNQRSRSEEHTSELQSLAYLVCRLLLEKKKKKS